MVRRRTFLFGLASLLPLSACGPQAPPYQDPLADISGARIGDVPVDAPVRAGTTVAYTVGSNVERWLKYVDEGNKYAASVGASQQLLAAGNPQNVINGAVAILRRRYPDIQLVDDLATAARRHIATTFALDIQSKWGALPGSEITSDIAIIAFDAQQHPVSRISGHGVSIVRPYVTPDPLEAPQKAIAELSAKADRLLS